jgi:Putative transposase of IS4/5 family (DUF4096)
MWTEQSRGRMAKIAKKTKRYRSDLTDEEWEQIAPLMPPASKRGRPREVDFREIINALRYLGAQAAAGRCCRSILGHGKRFIGGFVG